MKSIVFRTLAILPLFCFVLLLGAAHAQPPTPPEPPGHGQGGNQGAGAPIDGGIVTTLLLAAGYGGWKLLRKTHRHPPPGK